MNNLLNDKLIATLEKVIPNLIEKLNKAYIRKAKDKYNKSNGNYHQFKYVRLQHRWYSRNYKMYREEVNNEK